MIGAYLIALVTHVQVLPLFDTKTYEFQPGAVIYTEPTPDSHFSLSVTHTSTATGLKLGAKWKF